MIIALTYGAVKTFGSAIFLSDMEYDYEPIQTLCMFG